MPQTPSVSSLQCFWWSQWWRFEDNQNRHESILLPAILRFARPSAENHSSKSPDPAVLRFTRRSSVGWINIIIIIFKLEWNLLIYKWWRFRDYPQRNYLTWVSFYNERLNGRMAMIGFIALILQNFSNTFAKKIVLN